MYRVRVCTGDLGHDIAAIINKFPIRKLHVIQDKDNISYHLGFF